MPERILIIKLSALGDVVHSLPFLEVLRSNFPRARIDWLVEEEAAPILEGHPGLDRLIVSQRKRWQQSLGRIHRLPGAALAAGRFIKELRRQRYDLVIDLQGLLRSGLLTGLSRGRRKIGLDGSREGGWFFLNEDPVAVDYDQHAIERYLQVAEHLACRLVPWKGDLPVFQEDQAAVERLMTRHGLDATRLVAINPMARWESKLWGADRFARVADRLIREGGWQVVFTGSSSDARAIQEIITAMHEVPVNLAGHTGLKELACLYARCRALISTDTGPMHIAAAMGCPVVALFGPTAPWRTGPCGFRHQIVRKRLDCSPCFKKHCHDPRCMRQISVEEVFKTTIGVLSREATPG